MTDSENSGCPVVVKSATVSPAYETPLNMPAGSRRLAVVFSDRSELHQQARSVDAVSHLNATGEHLVLTEQICLTLFDRWCEQRNVLALAYLLHAWPLVGNAALQTRRLLQSLRELTEYHREILLSEELDLLGVLLD